MAYTHREHILDAIASEREHQIRKWGEVWVRPHTIMEWVTIMRHDWELLHPGSMREVVKYGWEPRRRCRNCGVVQQRETEHLWMRLTGYKWRPLAGRCNPKGDQNDEITT